MTLISMGNAVTEAGGAEGHDPARGRGSRADKVPLCVDLDETLLRTDLLYESAIGYVRNAPWRAFLLPFWLTKGRAFLKDRIAGHVSFDPRVLPYNEPFLAYLKAERAAGRKLVLVTASDARYAELVASEAGIFDEWIGSDGSVNYKGTEKRKLLVSRFGEGGFDYAGDSTADLDVWRSARRALVVSDDPAFVERVRHTATVEKVFTKRAPDAKTFARVVRIHQWVKNLLLFVPLLTAHVADPARIAVVAAAFVSFGLCASAVYVINDLSDLDADRRHPTKRKRPFASGDVPVLVGAALAPACLAASFVVAAFVGGGFPVVLAGYFAVTLAYSLRLKAVPLVDIVVLAGLYTVRVLAGGYAARVPVSPWLLVFSMFFFFGLAAAKRFSELLALRSRSEAAARPAGRGYTAADLEAIGTFGVSAGFLSVLVVALYVTSSDVTRLYSRPDVLLLACPLVMYWVARIWLLAHRGVLHEDPIVFAITDKVSYVVGGLTLFVLAAAA